MVSKRLAVRTLVPGIGSVLILLSACNERVSDETANTTEEAWLRFGREVVSACRAHQVSRLVDDLSVDLEDVKALYNRIRAANPDLGVPQIETTEELRRGLASKTKSVVETFLRSYEDLCEYEPATLSVRAKKQLGVESHAVIIWVRTAVGLEGVFVKDVVLTPAGPKVNDWLGPPGDPSKPESSMWRKRARLRCSSIDKCTYPEWITFDYEYRN